MGEIKSFRDLGVYQKLVELHLEVHKLTLAFPKFETYELGSQMRRSSNAAPAILAEGWGSRHANIYIESVNRSLGEVRETEHHLDMAARKQYLCGEKLKTLNEGYDSCGRMLERLNQSLAAWRNKVRIGTVAREDEADYTPATRWTDIENITFDNGEDFQ